jgi:hypothetical protein
MYEDFYKNKRKETIILSNLSSLNGRFSEYYNIWSMRYEKKENHPKKSKEEIEAEIKKEIMKKKEKLKNESLDIYDVDDKKSKELESTFKQLKLKVYFKDEPKILKDGKFYTISQGCFIMYDDKLFNKLYEIKFGKDKNNKSAAIQLDNNDLVLHSDNQIFIYRLKDGKYSLLQKIEENRGGFELQYSHSGCMRYPKSYKVDFIKEISGNRFICVSNYGFKIYSLNKKNEYSIILLNEHYEGIEMIHEIDENKFIFCTNLYCGDSLGGPAHNILLIDLITLKGITKDEIDKKLQELTKKDYYYDEDDYYFGFNKKKNKKIIDKNEIKTVIESLKLTCKSNQIFEYSTYSGFHNFNGYVIIKNKFFIIMIDNYIDIFDLFNGNNLKTYEILIDEEDNLYKAKMKIKKWNNNEDNEFFLFENGNIVLFELKEEQTKEIKLKIINQSYYPDIKNIEKLSEKNNKFYDKSNLDINNWGNNQNNKKDKNENRFSISIF